MSGGRLLTQPLVGIISSTTGLIFLLVGWTIAPVLSPGGWEAAMPVALAVIGAQYLAFLFPVHIRYTLKIEMGSVPLYLAAVLLPAPMAGATVALGSTLTEMMARSSRGSTGGDIATQVGRWTSIVVLGSTVAHLAPAALTMSYLCLLPTVGLILWAGDLLTIPVQIAPINGEPLRHLLIDCVKGVGVAEAFQYFLGMVGAVVALGNVWNTTLLLVPVLLVHRLAKRTNELNDGTRALLEGLADQVDSKDPFTHEHSVRVTALTRKLLRELQVAGPEAELIATAARLHDIGKISLPDAILHKHESLTPDEWAIMEQHPVIGADMVSKYPAFARGASIIRHHHEHLDGTGYPDRVPGTAIPFGARVLAVADSFDAMVSDRPYRAGMGTERACAILRAGRGQQWDSDVVDALMSIVGEQPNQNVQVQPGRPPLASTASYMIATRVGE